jgi:hypothetical protein
MRLILSSVPVEAVSIWHGIPPTPWHLRERLAVTRAAFLASEEGSIALGAWRQTAMTPAVGLLVSGNA